VKHEGPTVHSPDLLGVVNRGATRRRHRFLRDLRIIAFPIVIAALFQAGIYGLVLARGGREDWQNFLIVAAILALVPLVTGSLLISMRRQEFPLTVAALLTIVAYSFAISGLSSFRVPISYVGVLMTIPPTVFLMVYANVRFRHAVIERVGILAFPGAEKLRQALGGRGLVTVIDGPFADMRDVDRVLIDGASHLTPEWSPFLTRAHMMGVEVTPWLKFMETRLRRVDVRSFDISHLSFSTSQIYYSQAKRAIDVLAAVVLAPFVLMLCAVVACYIWAIDGGPVIFRQQRRGYGGSTFTLYKFRTMYRGVDGRQVQANDTRILPGARFLRLLRIDELPQVVNILRGEMSWIGPRPVAVPIAEELEQALPQYAHRHLVLPGLTGWAQVIHKYASNPEEEIEKLSYDLYYIKELSFDLDVLILLKTAQILLLRRGAR
jgi:lipopolysaccharide/colanic/teichoic acid biosynthesis glycosyltransferase